MQRFTVGQRIQLIATFAHLHDEGVIVAVSSAGGYDVQLDDTIAEDQPSFFYAEEVVLASQTLQHIQTE